ncbi:MAG: hypothetical protein ACK47B_14920 [Armatimonadota bacterium]
MAIELEYVVALPCPPKRRFGVEGLRERLRLCREAGDDAESARRALEAEFELRPLAFHCGRCPANHLGQEFGCYGELSEPLSAPAEEWLADLLPPSLKTRKSDSAELTAQVAAVRRLIEAFRAEGSDLEPVAALREAGVLERPQGVQRRYGWLWSRVEIGTDQLLALLLGRDQVLPADAERLLRALGAWTDGPRGPEGLPEAVFTLPPDPEDPADLVQLKQLFYALIVACSLEVAVAISRRELPAPRAPGPVPAPSDAALPVD